MADPIRCPSCGATNPAGSAWCGQCLARFDVPAETRKAAPPAPVTPPLEKAPVVEAPPVAEAPKLEAVRSAGVRRQGEGLVWTCPACEAVNPIEASACSVCATPMSAVFGVRPGKPELKRTGSAAIGWSMLLPGAGHFYAGRIPDGIARALLFLWTIGIGILLLTRHPSRGKGVMHGLGAVYVIAALGVWAIALIESQRLSRGEAEPLIPGRVLLWSSAALTLVLFLGLAAATQSR